MNAAPLRIVKVGGSLLDWPNLKSSLSRWLAQQSPAHHVFIAGGGSLVRDLNALQESQRLSDEAVHWLAVDRLDITAQLLQSLLPAATARVEQWPALMARLARADALRSLVLHVSHFLREFDAESAAPLPHDWSVTSDAIAARVAANLSAAELVLLKSALPEPFSTLAELSASGYVDRYFPVAAAELTRVRLVNLREASFAERTWPGGE